MNPIISILIKTYNYARYIRRAIDSAINQDFPKEDYEIVIVDDGSTDNTLEILKKYGKRIKIIRQKHIGYVNAINTGIKNCKGSHIIQLDADDEFLPGILGNLYKTLVTKNAAFAYCDYYEVDERSGVKKIVSLKKNLFNSVAGGILFKKNILEEFGGYDQNLILPEYDLLLKMLKKGYTGAYVEKPMFVYYRHGESITANKNRVKEAIRQLMDKYGKDISIREY